MKSFDIIFTTDGQAILHNIKGVNGLDCLDLTKPFINELEDKSDPAETTIDPEHEVISDDVYEDGK